MWKWIFPFHIWSDFIYMVVICWGHSQQSEAYFKPEYHFKNFRKALPGQDQAWDQCFWEFLPFSKRLSRTPQYGNGICSKFSTMSTRMLTNSWARFLWHWISAQILGSNVSTSIVSLCCQPPEVNENCCFLHQTIIQIWYFEKFWLKYVHINLEIENKV